ncbi:MAG: glycosyltransferase family 9 protein, partial [Acetomicrobium flavidum]|nr:glycosyltransferase family 9 protein [Acetomicrobium flavidum]
MAGYNPPSGTKDEKILFIRYSALGDVVRAIPLAATIKATLPEVSLTWLLVHPYE